jgi:hypothetical protein
MPSTQAFQFIDLSSNDPSLRKKNAAKIRSHVIRSRKPPEGPDGDELPILQFIYQTNNDPDLRKQNTSKVRSHVMRVLHRRRQTEGSVTKTEERATNEETGHSLVHLSSAGQIVAAEDVYRQIMNQSFLEPWSSPWSQVETNIAPTLMSRLAPTGQAMSYHCKLRYIYP